MPAPICPAPMTPTVSMLNVIFPSSKRPRRAAIIDEQAEASSRTPRFFHKAKRSLSPNQTLAADLAKLRGEFGQRGVKIGHQTIVGDLEDRRLLVLVDGDDDLRVLHPGEVLDRA